MYMWSADRTSKRSVIVVRWLMTLAMPGALLFADTIVFQTRSVPVWSGALVTGQTAQGACETVRVGGMGPELQLPLNLIASAEDGSCPARIYAFSRLSRPVLMEGVRFTADAADRITVTLPPVARVEVKQWILTCRGNRGGHCGDVLDPNNLHADAAQDVTFASKVMSDNMLGILVIPKAREDVHRSPAGEQLDAFLGQSPRPDCPTIAARLQTAGMFITRAWTATSRTFRACPGRSRRTRWCVRGSS